MFKDFIFLKYDCIFFSLRRWKRTGERQKRKEWRCRAEKEKLMTSPSQSASPWMCVSCRALTSEYAVKKQLHELFIFVWGQESRVVVTKPFGSGSPTGTGQQEGGADRVGEGSTQGTGRGSRKQLTVTMAGKKVKSL